MSPPGESQPLTRVTACVDGETRDRLAAIGGPGGLSAGARMAITAGLAALADPAAPCVGMADCVDELALLSQQLGAISGRRTPCGSWWIPSPSAAPDADLLDPRGDVLVSPDGVLLLGTGKEALTIDLAEGRITAIDGTGEVSVAITAAELPAVAALVAPSLIGLAQAGPSRRELGHGLVLERTATGAVRLALGGVSTTLPVAVAWQWCAELMGLVTRGLQRSADARAALDRQLEASHG